MRAVVQRILEGCVHINDIPVASVNKGLLIYTGVSIGDESQDAEYIAQKIIDLRIFPDTSGKMNLSIKDSKGEILLISNFTLCGDCRKGRRPSFDQACDPDTAQSLYQIVINKIKQHHINIQTGAFGAYMTVTSINDGPVTFLLDSRKQF